MSHYKYVPTSAEAFVIIFRRTIDWHGLASILFDLPPVQQKSHEWYERALYKRKKPD